MTELYRNSHGCVYQDDKKSVLIVEFENTSESLNIPCFFCLKKYIDAVDLEAMANNTTSDIEIVNPCNSRRCYVLTLTQAYYFQDLLAGTKAMMELNSIIRQKLYSYALEAIA